MQSKHILATKMQPTTITQVTFQMLHGIVKDLTGVSGAAANAKSLFDLVNPNASGFCSKVHMVVNGASPIATLSVAKVGPNYSVIMTDHAGGLHTSDSAKKLVSLTTDFQAQIKAAEVITEDLNAKHLVKLKAAIKTAVAEKGRSAEVRDVLKALVPNLSLRVGDYRYAVTGAVLVFKRMLGHMTVNVMADNGFTLNTIKASELAQFFHE